ncbi:MAG TPA: hypothetical protein VHM02_05545, partial [Thermoanaerobaculia bacterium]|nr:hypothetical protein [Thermoanaerobaculia bacterium]
MRIGLVLVVAGGMSLSAWWAARVPIFGAPDEDTHFDYVVTLVTAGRLLLASELPVAQIGPGDPFIPIVHPYTRHLSRASATRHTRMRTEVKAPAGYGSEEFFDEVDRTAPSLDRPPVRNPWGVTGYPVGYYALAALWVSLVTSAADGPVAIFFAARSFSVLLLGLGLVAWWAVLRRKGCPPWKALGVLAATAFLPLTSFVSSYGQPDNLTFFAVALCLWLGLRAAQEPPSAVRLAAAGAALGLLLITKLHVFACVAAPVLALLAVAHARWEHRRWLAWSVLLLGPSLLAGELQSWISSGGELRIASYRSEVYQEAGGSLPVYLARVIDSGFRNFFTVHGDTFRSFWWQFGWLDTPVVIVSAEVHEVVLLALQVGMAGLLILLVFRWQQVATSLVGLWRRGARSRALRLLVSDPTLLAYLSFAALIGAIYVVTANGFLAQGRNWYPFVPAIFWAAVGYSPRALASRVAARWLSRAVLAGLLLYVAFGAWYAIPAIEERYFGPGPAAPAEIV